MSFEGVYVPSVDSTEVYVGEEAQFARIRQ